MAQAKEYKTKRWRRFRIGILSRDKYKCQECIRKGEPTAANTVHHCDPDALDLFYSSTNLISLCDACHNSMHDRVTDELTDAGEKWLLRSRRGRIKKINLL